MKRAKPIGVVVALVCLSLAHSLSAEVTDTSQSTNLGPEEACGLIQQEERDGVCPLNRSSVTYQTNRSQPAGVSQRLIIESLDFAGDSVVLRNVSGAELAFTRIGRGNGIPWRLESGDIRQRLELPGNLVLPPNGRVRIHLRAEGEDDANNVYLNASRFEWTNLRPSPGVGQEVAILSPYG